MRRKIHITEHGVQDAVQEPVASGDPATDPVGETVGGEQPTSHGRQERNERHGGNGAEAALEARAAELEARVQELDEQLRAANDQNLRTLAEFQNYRRRMEEENRRYAQFANEELIRALLPVLDNFERALAASDTNRSFEALMGGVALTHRQLIDLLKKSGVEPIETKGQLFDPNYHEAVERVEADMPENSIVQELQKGYTMNSRVLRPSLVKVAGG